jgi:hypothetical protein
METIQPQYSILASGLRVSSRWRTGAPPAEISAAAGPDRSKCRLAFAADTHTRG